MNSATLLQILSDRFDRNHSNQKAIAWPVILKRIQSNKKAIDTLIKMEETGGEPAFVEYDKKSANYLFYDCSKESPLGRRSLCYDQAALDGRKENKPKGNVEGMANEIGIELLDEEQYRKLQMFIHCDTKTSSWIQTPPDIRKLGGALFCDRRYETVFVYHNGAESYYAARGFRGLVRV